MVAEDPDFQIRDLHDAIAKGDSPEWRLEMQIMPFADAADYRFNPFDLTKVWPHSDCRPITVGRMVLDRNPENYFSPRSSSRRSSPRIWSANRSQSGQDVARAAVQLPRHAPVPDRHQLPAAADQPAQGGRQQLQQGRRDALPAQR
jgi:hypothetical protein